MSIKKLGFATTTIVIIIVALLVLGAIWQWQNKQNSPFLRLTSPNGGEKWEIGKSYDIKWTTNLGKGTEGYTIVVFLAQPATVVALVDPKYKTKTLFDNLASDLPTENTVNWFIPKDINPGFYIISITAYGSEGHTVIDTSNAPFNIVAPTESPK